MPDLNPLLTVRLSFIGPDDKGSISYSSHGESPKGAVPFFVPLPMKLKGRRKPTLITVEYGYLPDGSYYAQTKPLSNKDTCVGCIVSLLTQSQVMLWHLIQEKILTT